jgi:chromosome segregation ATPase
VLRTLLEPAASATHHALREVLESAESDPFLESTPSTTHQANVALGDGHESVEPGPSGKLKSQNDFLTARNKTLAEENVDLRSRLQESDKKVNELWEIIEKLQSEKDEALKQNKELDKQVNSLDKSVRSFNRYILKNFTYNLI